MMKKGILLLAILGMFGCKDKAKTIPLDTASEKEVAQSGEEHPGKKIMETECYLCHNPKASQASMIAPPMIAVKKHYIDDNTTKEEFIESLILWINDPEAPSKMPGAQQRFGKMPYLPYPKETITQIAEYIYDHEIEEPEWFSAHFEEEHGNGNGRGMGKNRKHASDEVENDLSDIGLGYALATKAALGKNLMKAINEKGTVGAIEFCNMEAMKLTDSMSVMKNAIIKRVSDKPRNPKNRAVQDELDYIAYFKKVVASGGEIEPIIHPNGDEVNFYYPITTNTMCLQCHGKPNEQVNTETLATLKSLYPDDMATGYDVNEVRGIWAIAFDAEAGE
ncbi:DUF3365 domain-containing protein [Maribacter algicola]|uniref:DUF3365 domain-containing protein n=1 Tax=Meishania litoralis TaxID=3434685 RepID=A0ACC7LLF4_9FLAO